MLLRYYNPSKNYSPEELQRISDRLDSEIAGAKKFQQEYVEQTPELEDALSCFLVIANKAKASIAQRNEA